MKRSFRRLTVVVLFVLFILGAAGFVMARVYLDPFLKNALQDLVQEKSHGVYQLSIKKLRVNVLNDTLRAYGIRLQTDTIRLAEPPAENARRPAKIMFSAGFAGIYHVHWWEYWKTGALAISAIELDSPIAEIILAKDSLPVKDTLTTGWLDRLPASLAPLATQLSVGQMRIQKGSLLIRTERLGRITLQSADQIHLRLANIRLSPNDTAANDRPLYADSCSVSWQNYRLWTVGERYLFQIAQAGLSGQTLDVRDCSLRSVHQDSITRAGPPQRRPRIYFDLARVTAEGCNVFEAVRHGAVQIRRLDVTGGRFEASTNMNLPLPKRRSMPNEAWQKLRFPCSIDSLSVSNVDIVYHRQTAEGQGQLSFLNTELLALNLSNDSTLMTDTTPAQVYATTRFMGAGELSVALTLPLLSPRFCCPFRINLANMPFSAINSLLLPKTNLRAEEGLAKQVEVWGQATSVWTKGWVRMYYEDLKVAVLKEDSSRKKPLASALVNLLVRNNSDDKKQDKEYREEAFAYQRAPEDGFLHLLWLAPQGALIKMLSTVPVKPKRKK